MTTRADFLVPGSMNVVALLGLRLSALVAVAPVFSAVAIPVRIRAALVLVLTVVLYEPARARAHAPELDAAAAAAEVVTGLALGFGAALFAGAAEAAGDVMTTQMGLSGASLLDPFTQISVPVLSQFFQLFVVTIMLACDAHLVMLDALAASLRLLPIGSPVQVTSGLHAIVSLGGTLLLLGVKMAAPVMGAVLIANVALALLSRAAPQLNVLSVAFPLQIGLGLFVIAAALPMLAGQFANWSRSYDAALTPLLDALGAGAR